MECSCAVVVVVLCNVVGHRPTHGRGTKLLFSAF